MSRPRIPENGFDHFSSALFLYPAYMEMVESIRRFWSAADDQEQTWQVIADLMSAAAPEGSDVTQIEMCEDCSHFYFPVKTDGQGTWAERIYYCWRCTREFTIHRSKAIDV